MIYLINRDKLETHADNRIQHRDECLQYVTVLFGWNCGFYFTMIDYQQVAKFSCKIISIAKEFEITLISFIHANIEESYITSALWKQADWYGISRLH